MVVAAAAAESNRLFSLIVMADDPVLAWLDPEPTRCRYPAEKALRHFQSWTRHGFPVGDFKFFDLDLVERMTFSAVTPPV
jgi:hypothetical protein